MRKYLPSALPEIEWLSPSGYLSLRSCFLRFGLDRLRPRYEQKISNPAAMLGTAAHFVLEEAGKSGGLPSAISEPKRFCEDKWNEEVGRQVALLRKNKFDGHLLKPETWPNYYLQRARAVRMGTAMLLASKGRKGGGKSPLVEATIESPRLKIRGRLDRVEFGADGAHLIDWKSSLQSEDGEVSEQYRCQLLLYAGIYHDQHGEWPTKARLSTFAGEVAEFEIKTPEAEALLKQAIGLIADYNSALSKSSISDLGRPSVDACNFCDYRGFCEAYWRNRPNLKSLDVEGQVKALCVESQRDRWSITIDCSAGDSGVAPIELVNLDPVQFFYLSDLRVGQAIRAVRLARSSMNEQKYFAGPRSYIVIL